MLEFASHYNKKTMKKALSIAIWLAGAIIALLLVLTVSGVFGTGDYAGEAKETLYFPASEIWTAVVDTEGAEVLDSDLLGPIKWKKDGGTFERWRYDNERGYVVKMTSSDSGASGMWSYELTPYDASKTMVKVVVEIQDGGLFGNDFLTAEEELERIKGVLE